MSVILRSPMIRLASTSSTLIAVHVRLSVGRPGPAGSAGAVSAATAMPLPTPTVKPTPPWPMVIGFSTTSSERVTRPALIRSAPAVPPRSTSTWRVETVNVNLPVKNPNTSIVAVPASASNSPSRSIVWLPTTGAVPSAAAQSSAARVRDRAPGRRAVVVMRPGRAVVRERAAGDDSTARRCPQATPDLGRLDTDPGPGVGEGRADRRRRRLEHRDRELGPVVDHQMRTARPARS